MIELDNVIAAIKTVSDPEIPTNIFDLGLIYNIKITNLDNVEIEMTLTTGNCPVAELLPLQVQEVVETVEGVNECRVQIVWEPTWEPDMMTLKAKLELNML